jgi:hypothetical protein
MDSVYGTSPPTIQDTSTIGFLVLLPSRCVWAKSG